MSSDGSRPGRVDARAALDAWRASGADRVNPLRFHLIDALDRRAAAYGGQARQRLDERLAGLIQAYQAELTGAGGAAGPDALPASAQAGPIAGPLAGLVSYIDRPAPADRLDTDPGAAPAAAGLPGPADHLARDALGLRAAYPELPLLDEFRALWSRFSADRQVRQSQEQVHKNAGPLNSNQLVHRALSLMRELSPGYLQQFLSYTDALMWMEQMTAASAPAAKEAPRASAARKSSRGKSRKESKPAKENKDGA